MKLTYMPEEIKHWETKRGGAGSIHENFIYNYHYNKTRERMEMPQPIMFRPLFTDIEPFICLKEGIIKMNRKPI
jgi:hypothetical protein